MNEFNLKPEHTFNDKEVAIIMLNLNYQLVDVIDSIKPLINTRYFNDVDFKKYPDFINMLNSDDYKITYAVAARAYHIVYENLVNTLSSLTNAKEITKHINTQPLKINMKQVGKYLDEEVAERVNTIIDAINFGSNILDTIYTIGQYYPLSKTDGLFIIEYITRNSVINDKKYYIEDINYSNYTNYHLGYDKLKPILDANADLIDEFYDNLFAAYEEVTIDTTFDVDINKLNT